MSSQRIRYSEVRPGVLLSRRNFVINSGQTVQVELDLNSKKFRVIDSITNEEVTSGGNTINISVLKIRAKKALTTLGVGFIDETRDRGEATVG